MARNACFRGNHDRLQGTVSLFHLAVVLQEPLGSVEWENLLEHGLRDGHYSRVSLGALGVSHQVKGHDLWAVVVDVDVEIPRMELVPVQLGKVDQDLVKVTDGPASVPGLVLQLDLQRQTSK